MSRPHITRTATGAIVLYLDAPAVTVTLSREEAVMLAHELAGCVDGLTVMVTGEAGIAPDEDPPHAAGWVRACDALPPREYDGDVEIIFTNGVRDRGHVNAYCWPGARKLYWRYTTASNRQP